MSLVKSLIFLTFCITGLYLFLKIKSLIKLFFFIVAVSIRCFSCDNDSCGRASGYAMEDCGMHVNRCYILKNIGSQIYRAGCLPNPRTCDELKKSGDSCTACDSNNCNGMPLNNPPIGSGTQYNSAQYISLTPMFVMLFASFIFIFV